MTRPVKYSSHRYAEDPRASERKVRVKYLRDEIFELRAEHGGNIFRVFFIFDDGNVVMRFNGFQKKSQKTPEKEINKAIQLKKEYYAGKK